MDKNLDFLNSKQLEAVKRKSGSLLILAGAGSGKTRVLTMKIYYILTTKSALPNQILAVTFTNKAANEMKNRVSSMVNQSVEGWWIGTFHSIAAKILRRHADQIGLKKDFVIIDKEDQLKIIKDICTIEKINLEDKNYKFYLSCIENFKNQFVGVEKAKNDTFYNKDKNVVKIYELYENELKRLNCCDFGNLLVNCIEIFKKNKKLLTIYQNQFKFILVDEYQDTNFAQQELLKYLYEGHKNICCVGDDDQSIYSWRGAQIKNILTFDKTFNLTKIFYLEQNYRSTQKILNCASNLINHNIGRYNKKLWSDNLPGDKIQVKGFFEVSEEAIDISSEIENLVKEKVSLNEIAILMRISAHTRSFEDRFLNIGLPYRIIGGLRFYERKEIKDVIAYLRITNNLNDDLALERIINVPKRGIGKITLNHISLISRKDKISKFEACRKYLDSNINKKNIHQINDIISKIYKWHKLKEKINHIELTETILQDSGYLEFIRKEDEQKEKFESYDRLDNINEFINSLKNFENLDGFLEHISLVFDNDNTNNDNKINIMTIHSAKGLEFEHVFLIGWEDGVFPSKRSIEEKGKDGLEEERRLAYVAITRAKKNVYISYVNQNRYSYQTHDVNIPSRFISELPKEDLEFYNTEFFFNENDYELYEEDESKVLTPGKKRLIENKKQNEIDDWDLNQDNMIKNESSFIEGERIFHYKFGYGRILEIDGYTAQINFEKTGTKMVFLKYLHKK